jgi:hypothetical protein
MKKTLGGIVVYEINKYLHLFQRIERNIRFNPISLIRIMIESKEINLDDTDVIITFDLLLMLSLANVAIAFNSEEKSRYYLGPTTPIDIHCNRELYHLLTDETDAVAELSNIRYTTYFVRYELYLDWLKALRFAKNRASLNWPKPELNIFHIYSYLREQSRKRQTH